MCVLLPVAPKLLGWSPTSVTLTRRKGQLDENGWIDGPNNITFISFDVFCWNPHMVICIYILHTNR